IGRGYGFSLRPNARNTTITGLDITSTGGAIIAHQGSLYENITISENKISNPDSLKFGIYFSVRNERLRVEKNTFYDSQGQMRCAELWYMNDGSYSYNKFQNVGDGGHIMEPHNNVQVSYNLGRQIHRMGIEIQGDDPGQNLTVQGNVFYDWYKPFYDSFGLSV